MSTGKTSSNQTRERRYSLLHLSAVKEESTKVGDRQQNSQAVPSFNGIEVYVCCEQAYTNMILKETASYAFYLVIFQSRLFCVEDLRKNNLGMGNFVQILISRDNKVLLTKAQLFWVKIIFAMNRTIREMKARVKQKVGDSEVANFI